MEAMSQDAIEEMVDNAFKSADLDNDGLISFDEFKKWVCNGRHMGELAAAYSCYLLFFHIVGFLSMGVFRFLGGL